MTKAQKIVDAARERFRYYGIGKTRMQEIAQDAVRFARQYMDADLDFSPESLEVVEAQLDSIARSLPKGFVRRLLRGPSGFADVLRPTFLWGSYVGEVIRRHWGGE